MLKISGGAIALNTSSGAFVPPTASLRESSGHTEYVGKCELPTKSGSFILHSYRYSPSQELLEADPCAGPLEPVVLVAGDLSKFEGRNVPVRIHDQCLTSEVLGSQRCDCKEQLELAKDYILEHGGAIIYMQQEGRGIGLANKIAAYELQDQGMDTVDANRHLGFKDDHRNYECVPYILKHLGIDTIQLMTNNPYKVSCLGSMGVPIGATVPMQVTPNKHNERYMRVKAERMQHELKIDGKLLNRGMLPRAGPRDKSSPSSLDFNGGAVGVSKTRLPPGGKVEGDKLITDTDSQPKTAEPSTKADKKWCFGRQSVIDAVEVIRQGGVVVVVDDEDRENEGDFIMAAELATPETIGFIIRYSSGVICCGMEDDDLQRLNLPQMVPNNEDPKQTAFTLTVDAKEGVTTGISAYDRARTFRALASQETKAKDLNRPGHIFPLRARSGGVLTRDGHTEASVDLCKLAGLRPAGVLCEIVSKDNMGMARLPELQEFCEEHSMVLTSIQDMISYREELLESGESPF
eukprot:CAMPEP_0117751264 /NCGR_PEP_ID=MMETSP0947-20121206/10867_1 /TAXON_ID=44440 /ORGANISM="Chattonella subsalsa, Strain CCMP2191" /LENGTH=519 /DNA_ID=CAMNT_0005569603 /DNA_START=569 /DNA_END=2128 /DNA_ORIENTATION=+